MGEKESQRSRYEWVQSFANLSQTHTGRKARRNISQRGVVMGVWSWGVVTKDLVGSSEYRGFWHDT